MSQRINTDIVVYQETKEEEKKKERIYIVDMKGLAVTSLRFKFTGHGCTIVTRG